MGAGEWQQGCRRPEAPGLVPAAQARASAASPGLTLCMVSELGTQAAQDAHLFKCHSNPGNRANQPGLWVTKLGSRKAEKPL